MSINILKPQAIKDTANVEVGDIVALPNGNFVDTSWVAKVERVTKTQFVTRSGRFNRVTGALVGNMYMFKSAVIVGPDYVEALNEAIKFQSEAIELRTWFNNNIIVKFPNGVPVGAMRAMKAAYETWQNEQKEPE